MYSIQILSYVVARGQGVNKQFYKMFQHLLVSSGMLSGWHDSFAVVGHL